MTAPSPFDVSRAIANNVGRGAQTARDENAIERILSQASQSGNPQVLQDSIGKILSQVSPERQGPAMQYLQNAYATVQQKQEKAKAEREGRAAADQAGYTYGAPPQVQAQQTKDTAKSGRLAQYGLGGGQPQGQVASVGGTPVAPNSIQPNQEALPNPVQSPFKKMTDDQLVLASGAPDKEVSEPAKEELKSRQEERKLNREEKTAERTYHSKTSLPAIEAASKVVRAAPSKKGLINQHRRDIDSGNVTGYGQFLADKTGWEIFRNPEAARARSAAKQYFIQSLNSLAAGARPNIFLEQQLSAGQTQIGREEEANQTVLDLMEFTDDLEEQRARYILEEAEKDEKVFGFAKNDVERRADKRMIPYAEQREDEMAYTIRKRHEDELDDEKLVKEVISGNIPNGTPLTLRMANILMLKNNDDEAKAQAEAKRLGFIIPKEQTYTKSRK